MGFVLLHKVSESDAEFLREEGFSAFVDMMNKFEANELEMSLVEKDGEYWPAVVTTESPKLILAIMVCPVRLAHPDNGH